MRFRAPQSLAAFAVLLVGSLVPGRLRAQAVQGRVLAAGDETPLAGALVQLLDTAGAVVARAATTASGGFALTAPAAGRYHVVVRQIGQAAWRSPQLALATGTTHPLTIRPAPQPYTLPPITVAARRARCDIRIDDDDLLGRLLDAAGTALGVAEAAAESGEIGFSTDTWLKRLRPDRTLEDSAATDPPGLLRWPIESADPDSLRRWGFVHRVSEVAGPVYYGPDARVLFSEWFLSSHCFEADSVGAGLVQVEFQPERRGDRAGLAGRLLIDRVSLELRTFTFEYVGLPGWVPKGVAGGEIQLRRLPAGAWVPFTWMLRAPVPVRTAHRTRLRLHGWLETGGRVTAVHRRDGRVDPDLTAALLIERERSRRY
jgi:hypothetical protein